MPVETASNKETKKNDFGPRKLLGIKQVNQKIIHDNQLLINHLSSKQAQDNNVI